MTSDQYNNVKLTVEQLSDDYNIQFDTKNDICTEFSQDVILCRFLNKEYLFDSKEVKIPKKKPYTKEYVLSRLDALNNKVNISYKDVFEQLNNKLKLSLNVTEYGLGMESIFSSHEKMHNKADAIKQLLDEHCIKYTISVSEASWVYRFHISKSNSNINQIKRL